jgi:hypothetical protein
MITAISIQNFKGIGEAVEIELRPLTLLFGANSAGKSSILHALQYAAEIFERRNLNVGWIGDGEAGIDLGGFHNFVHGHNTNIDVTLKFTLDLSSVESLPSFSRRTPRDVDDPSTLYAVPRTARVAVSIGWSNLLDGPFVRTYTIDLDDEPLALISYEPGSPNTELSLNGEHATFIKDPGHSSIALWHPLEPEQLDEDAVVAQLLSWASHTGIITSLSPAKSPYTLQYGL